MKKKEKIIGLTALVIIIVFAYFVTNAKKNIENNIIDNNYQTICMIYKVESRRSFTHAYYYYYYNGKKYETWTNTNLSRNDILNKFYKVNISTENPQYSKILFEREINDTLEITKAGF